VELQAKKKNSETKIKLSILRGIDIKILGFHFVVLNFIQILFGGVHFRLQLSILNVLEKQDKAKIWNPNCHLRTGFSE